MEDVYFYNLLGKVGDILYKRPVSKWQSPRNLTSWNSPFSFISDGSFGRRRSRARSLIRPGFTRFLWKMHQKNNNNQSLTFLEKSTTLSIVVKKNLARKTSNQPSGDQKVSKKKEEERDFWKPVQKSTAKLPRQCQDRCSSEPPLQGIQTGQRCFSWVNKVFLTSKNFFFNDTFNFHHFHQNIVWNFQWKFSPSPRLCLSNNRFWCPSSSLSSQVYIWAKTDGVEFCPHFTGWLLPAKSPWITFQDFVSSAFFCMFRQFATQFSNASFSLSNQMVKV